MIHYCVPCVCIDKFEVMIRHHVMQVTNCLGWLRIVSSFPTGRGIIWKVFNMPYAYSEFEWEWKGAFAFNILGLNTERKAALLRLPVHASISIGLLIICVPASLWGILILIWEKCIECLICTRPLYNGILHIFKFPFTDKVNECEIK